MAAQLAELSQSETDIFNAEWDSFVATHFPERDFVDVFEDNKQQILDACKIAKYNLEAEFGGINAQTNEFGWSPILPNQILATTTPTYSTSTWRKNYATSDVTTMWKDWIGASGSEMQMSKYGCMIIIGFVDPVEVPKISAIKAKIKSTDYPIWYFDQAIRSGLHIYELPKPFVVEPTQSMYLRAKVARAGDDEIQPLGVMFGKGDWLRNESAYAQV